MRPAAFTFPVLLRDWFAKRLVVERGASACTVACYRDSFELLLRFAEQRLGRPPSDLTLDDLDAPLVLAFLDHLEQDRGNAPRTRNVRLAAIRSFMRYASMREPGAAAVAQRVLAIPSKRFDRPVLGFLAREEIEAVLDAPDRSTWSGERDVMLFTTMYNTGARVTEIVGVRVGDLLLERETAIRFRGKGRKERCLPLWKGTARDLRAWLTRIDAAPAAPLFPNRRGARPHAIRRRQTTPGRRLGSVRAVPDSRRPPDLTAHVAAHHRDAHAPTGRRHHRDRALAGARGPIDDPPLHRGRPRHEGGGPAETRRTPVAAPEVPRDRQVARVPRRALIMRTSTVVNNPHRLASGQSLRMIRWSA